jgi:hypothetical protein
MNKLIAAVAMAIALPSVAHAQAATAEKQKMECCDKMKDKCACCDKMAGKPASGSSAPSSDPHAGHDMAPGAAPAGGHPHH